MNIKELIEKRLKAPSNVFQTDNEFALNEYMAGRASLKDLKDTAGSLKNIADKKDIEKFINNGFMLKMMAMEVDCKPEELKRRAEALMREL